MTDPDDGSCDAMGDEFGVIARWTVEAIERVDPTDRLPPACRGTGGPGALAWLVDRMDLRPGASLLDVGSGVGGPAEYAARERDARPLPVESVRAASTAAHRLFGRPAAVGDGSRLPLADASVEAAWALGVLCTTEDRHLVLTEMARAVRRAGAIGLLVYVRTAEVLHDPPDGDDFPSPADLDESLVRAGLVVEHQEWLDRVPGPSQGWSDDERRVVDDLDREHRGHPAWRSAREQERRFARLLDAGEVRGLLLSCRCQSW